MDSSTHATLRATDADREACADRLRWAAGEGALSVEELDERLTAAYAAVRQGDLPPLMADLPRPPTAPAPPTRTAVLDQPSRFWIWALIPWCATGAWVHAAFVTRETRYVPLALIYALPLIVAFIATPGANDEIPGWATAIGVVFWIVGSIHAWMSRSAVDAARIARPTLTR